jgi:hypothetical protein
MTPGDYWKPPPDSSYSKEAVNRAGGLLLDFFLTELEQGQDLWDIWDSEKVAEAFFAVTWWKQQQQSP